METGTGVNNTVVSVDNSDGKRQKCSGIELEDRLGNLPDSILVHILSFLLTRDAVKTVLISRFAMHSFFMQGLQFINSASTLIAFTFSRNWHEYEHQEIQDDEEYIREMRLANEINSWIRFAVTKEV